MAKITGSCLCGKVKFHCENQFTQFHLCHCELCQKVTGSAHASNLFTVHDNIIWLRGYAFVKRFDVLGCSMAHAFCVECGSAMPRLSGKEKLLVVPAGSLDGQANIAPQSNICWDERAKWYDDAIDAPHIDGVPE